MVLEVLPPGVEHCQEADFSSEVLRIGCYLTQRFRCAAKKDVVDDPLVLQRDSRDLSRDREHHVEIVYGQKIAFAIREPFGGCRSQTLRTVSVPAGIVGDLEMTAAITTINMAAHSSRTTCRDIVEYPLFH